jgi:DNA (cytosine-5)-methyltransferase 1
MKYGSVCSGIEAASVAWESLGWSPAWFAEIEPFPAAVLKYHWPEVENLGDMTLIRDRINSGEIEAPDVLVGGTPCQAFSVAGLRNSLDDDRGQLTLEFVRLANAIDSRRTADGLDRSIIVWENVPGVLNTKDNAFGCFLGALAGEDCPLQPAGKKWTNAGCVYGPQRAVAWRILDAQYFGLAQRRRRVFVVASARAGFDPAAVLFEREGVRRDTPPRREARQTAPTPPARSTGGGGLGTDFDCDGGLIHVDPIASCVTAGEAKRQDWETCNFVAFHPTQDPISSTDGSTHALGCGSTGGRASVAVAVALRGREGGAAAELGDEVRNCLRASRGGGDKPHVLTATQVRRLTPRECERLMGFPDGHTDVPYRGKPAADGPRYKAIGNSMAVPVMHWIGSRIKRIAV